MTSKKKSKKRASIQRGLILVFSATACLSLFMIISTVSTQIREQKAFDELTAIVEQKKEKQDMPAGQSAKPELEINSGAPEEPAEAEPEVETDTGPVILPEYAAAYEQNSDFYGWLRIDDTQINYPVMFTPDDPQYYLRRAFDKTGSQSGTPFIDAACFEGCGNLVIYGHHIKNGTMFGSLPKYAEKDYWEQHKTICFDTLYEHGEYEIVAAFYGKAIAKGDPGFRYYQYTDLTDPAVFDEFMQQLTAAACYDTGVTAEYGDELITLSTCNYHTDDGRFAVVARKKR